jgi:hypothetical protein
VELVLGLWLLYALSLATWVPGRGTLFVRPLLGWCAVRGPGWRWAPPLPSAPALRGEPFPLRETADGIAADPAPTWRASQRIVSSNAVVATGELAGARARGRTVSIGDRPVAAAIDEDAAELLAECLRAASAGDDDTAAKRLHDAVRAGLSGETLRERLHAARAATRPLAWASDAYGVALLVGLPAVVAWAGAEAGLRLAAPVLATLHVASLIALGVAHARLYAGRIGERIETLLSAALYPPTLLRAGSGLVERTVGAFHPAALAAVLLRGARRDRVLRAELVRARCAAERPGALGLAQAEHHAIVDLLEAEGIREADLLAPPDRSDALARSYCPACGWEYRAPEGPCNDCGAPRVAYAS